MHGLGAEECLLFAGGAGAPMERGRKAVFFPPSRASSKRVSSYARPHSQPAESTYPARSPGEIETTLLSSFGESGIHVLWKTSNPPMRFLQSKSCVKEN